MSLPLVSVVMPVYNGGRYLMDAVASIVEQSSADWELVCVNDGSTDGSGDVLKWFADQDPRIRILNQSNHGIVEALNRGCAAARGPLIARMDCDDIATPNRFRNQVDFLRKNPQCRAVGGGILEIDADSAPLGVSMLPNSHEEIVENLLARRTGLFHPTTMIRTASFEAAGGYRSKFQWIEDHDLWLRLAERGELANTDDVVLCYRQHSGSVCWQRANQQRKLMNELLQEAFRIRNQPLPEDLVLESVAQRSPAGPGKWARAAAKGGYPLSVWKHIHSLWSSEQAWHYKTRMTFEACARLTIGYPSRLWNASQQPIVPTFTAWHARFEADRVSKPTTQAA